MRKLTSIMRKVRFGQIVIAIAATLVVVAVAPALGGPSLRSLVKQEVAKQISKATGPAGPNGTSGSNGTNGSNGTPGAAGTARAFGLVTVSGTLSRSKNVTDVLHAGPGIYCILLATGISASSTGLVAAPEFNGDTTNGTNTAHVEWDSSSGPCPDGYLLVRAWQVDTSNFQKISTFGGDMVNVPIYTSTPTDEAFFFVVP